MSRKGPASDFFYLCPPWGLLAGVGLFLLFGLSFLQRCSELGGAEVIRACQAGRWAAAAAAAAGLLPMLSGWSRDGFRFLRGFFVGAALRLVLAFGGICLLLWKTSIQPLWLVVFFGVSYGMFIAAETAVILWLLKAVVWTEENAE